MPWRYLHRTGLAALLLAFSAMLLFTCPQAWADPMPSEAFEAFREQPDPLDLLIEFIAEYVEEFKRRIASSRIYTYTKEYWNGRERIFFGVSVLLIVGGYAVAWLACGRDPRQGTAVPIFAPPDGLEPGFLGYVKTLRYDECLLLADLLQLAGQGQIAMHPENGALKVEKVVDEWGSDISPAHRRLLDAVFDGEEKTRVFLGGIDTDTKRSAPDLARRLWHFYKAPPREGAKRPKIQKSNKIVATACLLLFTPLILAVSLLDSPLLQEIGDSRIHWLPAIISAPLPAMLAASYLSNFLSFRRDHIEATRKNKKRRFLFWTVASFAFLLYAFYTGELDDFLAFTAYIFKLDLLLVSGISAAVFAASIFSALMPARTREGRRLLDAIEGFEYYLTAVEKERFTQMHRTQGGPPPTMTPELCGRFLPYAYALGLEIPWTKDYTHLLRPEKRGILHFFDS